VARRPGTLVISLDFELHWGVRDSRSLASYEGNLLAERTAVPRLLALFSAYGIHATWATVGFLCFRTKDELLAALPAERPAYENAALSPYPYLEAIGADEASDPFHFAPSLVEQIASADAQELATHTFSHYYCLEPGQHAGAFEADLGAALKAMELYGARPESIVFPRNQVNAAYLPICRRLGIRAYRATERSRLYAPRPAAAERRRRRAIRLLDAYLPVSHRDYPAELIRAGRPAPVPSSRFLRPYDPRIGRLERLRVERILGDLGHAATRGLVYHLWWHPHNLGANVEANFAILHEVLERFSLLRDRYAMESRSMGELAGAFAGSSVAGTADG
jgi:peptidoglycan/xylan/chitin deacetylase (PgdA/CDA1 family)